MKRLFLLLLGVLLLVPAAFVAMQDAPTLRLQITGINRTDFPTVVVNANVFDNVGQPVLGLGEENFSVVGELVDRMRVVKVENITDDSLSFAAVLAIDTSSSMAETPLQRTKEAAISFINLIGPDDPVAIVTFDTDEQLIQDFTTDKDLLISKINALGYGGRTALYDGGMLAVQTAANSPVPRRAVILLSDGAEYGGRSSSERSAALGEALRVGVPVYTIGEGFGYDRTYLQELADGTNATFHESPTPDQLLDIYNGLARTLRSQYIITLDSDLAADGKIYPLDLQVTANNVSAQARTQLRAPVPVPIPSITGLPIEPLLDPVDVVGDALSDDGLASAQFQIDNSEPTSLTKSPFIFTIDPATLSVGDHTLTFTTTDNTGDSASISQIFSVAPKPPTVAIDAPSAPISEPTSIAINATALRGQIRSLIVKLDGQPLASALGSASTSVTIDPSTLAPGTYTLTASATDTDGSRSESSATIEIAALPPSVAISGIDDGQTVSEATEVSIDGSSAQFDINTLIVKLNGQPIASSLGSASTSVTIDPITLAPGENTLTASAGDTNRGRAESSVTFNVPAFPPASISFDGLTTGETLTEDRTVNIAVDSPQTPVTAVVYTLDGRQMLTQTEEPFSFDLDVSAIGTGSHILSVTATNDGGQSLTADTAFAIAAPPTATATSEVTEVPATATEAAATEQPSNTPPPPTSTTAVEPTAESAATEVSATAVTQADVATEAPTSEAALPTDTVAPPTEGATVVAAVPTNTIAPTDTTAPTNTSVPPTNTVAPTDTTAPTDTVAPTNTTAPTDTVAPTDTTAPTVAATDTSEATAEVTEAVTETATEAVAPAATNTTAATDTKEATAESTNVGSSAPTFTPIPLTAETQGTDAQTQSPLLIGAICLVGLLLLAVIYWFAGRRRTTNNR
ncbi:MAG: VWA domain-containing protein [Anaerolineae bacterium]